MVPPSRTEHDRVDGMDGVEALARADSVRSLILEPSFSTNDAARAPTCSCPLGSKQQAPSRDVSTSRSLAIPSCSVSVSAPPSAGT